MLNHKSFPVSQRSDSLIFHLLINDFYHNTPFQTQLFYNHWKVYLKNVMFKFSHMEF